MLRVKYIDQFNESVDFDLYLEIPTGNNSANISWIDAITISGLYETETIEGINYIKINEKMAFSSRELSKLDRKNELDSKHDELQTQFLNKIRIELDYTGYEID